MYVFAGPKRPSLCLFTFNIKSFPLLKGENIV